MFGLDLVQHGTCLSSIVSKQLTKKTKGTSVPFFMRMKKIVILLFCIPFMAHADWGKTGHRVIGEIASHHLKPKAKRAISNLLEGRSLARIGTWADEIRSNPDYNQYTIWHYVNMPLDKKYEEVAHSQENVVKAIYTCIEGLKNKNTTREKKAFYLKYLIHCLADLHQPLHAGRAEDKGGNTIRLKYFGRNSNLHRVWDSEMINDYGMSYSELAKSLMERRNDKVVVGSPVDWANESQAEVIKIYAEVKEGDRLGYRYNYTNLPLVKDKLYKAGIRLAAVLNDLFG